MSILKKEIAEAKLTVTDRLNRIKSKAGDKANSIADKAVDFINKKSEKLNLPKVNVEAGLSGTTIFVVLVVVLLIVFKPKLKV